MPKHDPVTFESIIQFIDNLFFNAMSNGSLSAYGQLKVLDFSSSMQICRAAITVVRSYMTVTEASLASPQLWVMALSKGKQPIDAVVLQDSLMPCFRS